MDSEKNNRVQMELNSERKIMKFVNTSKAIRRKKATEMRLGANNKSECFYLRKERLYGNIVGRIES